MIDLIRATFLIFRSQLWRTLRSKRTLVCAGLASLPVALAFVVSLVAAGEEPGRFIQYAGNRISWNLIIQGLVPILSLIGGAAVVSEEIEDRTITYLLTSPIPRPAILLGRWAASFVWLGLLVAASLAGVLALLGAASNAPPAGFALLTQIQEQGVDAAQRTVQVLHGDQVTGLYWTLVAIGTLACGAYSAGFAALGARVKHPMIIGLAYIFAIEVFLTNLPGKTQSATIQFYLRSMAIEWAGPFFEGMRNFKAEEFDAGPVAMGKLLFVLISTLVLGSWVLSRRQYVMSS